MLTNNVDTEYEIMLNMNINDLSNLCMVNTKAKNLCNDDFWYRKFKHDDKNINFKPKNNNEWITMYKYNQYNFIMILLKLKCIINLH